MRALVIFAKEPLPGKVKTRLETAYPPETVLELYRSFLLDTLAMAGKVPAVKTWVFYESWGRPPRFLKKHAKKFKLNPQRGKDLGERLDRACRTLAPSEKNPIVIIGSDTPHLNRQRISQAFRLLQIKEAVIGPAQDGGFYLLGLRRFSKGIFDGIDWSTGKVLRQLLRNIKNKKMSFGTLPEEFDLDEPQDIERLRKSGRTCPPALNKALCKTCLLPLPPLKKPRKELLA